MIVDEEAYLEHFGVPGMKWGVRKKGLQKNIKAYRQKRRTASYNKVRINSMPYSDLTKSDKRKRVLNAVGITGVSVTVFGAKVAMVILKNRGQVKINSIVS